MPSTFDRDRFAEALGSKFKVTTAGDQTIDLELDEVTELKERSNQRSFSIIFLVPESHWFDQGLYDVEHEKLGVMQLFLVPVGLKQNRQELESLFNFLVDGDA